MILGIESSCDDTSAALVQDGVVLGQLISSQSEIHREYGGVVPELATRQHLRNLIPVTDQLLRMTGVSASDLDAIAVTRGPGLPNALRTGYAFAGGLALRLDRPLLGIHHHEAHLFSPFLAGNPAQWQLTDADFPFIGLIVSGGHTMLVQVRHIGDYSIIGRTIDDAAGECFDKVAKLIGFPYPGGPHIDRMSRQGNPKAYRFPRPMLHEPGFDFSFSGLKTAVRYFLRDHPGLLESESTRADLCASVQEAIVEILTAKSIQACLTMDCRTLIASGGVIANLGLRQRLQKHCQMHGVRFRASELSFSTDNAAMVAALAEARFKVNPEGASTDLNSEILASWSLEDCFLSRPVTETGNQA